MWEVRHCNILFDHTGEVMFSRSGEGLPLSMLDGGTGDSGARVALLPPSESLLKMVRFEDGKAVTSNVFCLNDIAMTSSGGLTSSSLVAEETGAAEPYAIYRTMSGVAHVVPHFRLVNETGFKVNLSEPGNGQRNGTILAVEDRSSGVVKPRAKGGYVTLELGGIGITGPVAIGRRVGTVVVKCLDGNGQVVGAVRVHTLDGGRFARLIGRVTFVRGRGKRGGEDSAGKDHLSEVDVIRAKLSLEGVVLCLKEGAGRKRSGVRRKESIAGGDGELTDGAVDLFGLPDFPPPPPSSSSKRRQEPNGAMEDALAGFLNDIPVASIFLTGLSVDNRVDFKVDERSSRRARLLRKSRVLLTVDGLNVEGLSGDFPTKISCGNLRQPFLQAAVKWTGALDDPVVTVDQIAVAVGGGKSELVVKTHENFLWKMLDIGMGIVDEAGVAKDKAGGLGAEREGDAAILAFTESSSEQLYWFKR